MENELPLHGIKSGAAYEVIDAWLTLPENEYLNARYPKTLKSSNMSC
jgi:hypothetical protein